MDREQREHAFAERLSDKVARNENAIEGIFKRSKVGQCGGRCKGFKESDLKDLCPECLEALEAVTDEIFSVSPDMLLLGRIMSSRD